MTTQTTGAQLRDDYLARLDAAMRGVPHGIAGEIRAGIAEELEGLDAAAAAARIAQLGDPVDIAREAQQEGAVPVLAPAPVPAGPPATSTRGFAIAAALTLSFGGVVLPFLGWVVGAVLVCLSTMWRTGEKVMAIVVPLVAASISALLAMGMWTITSVTVTGTGTTPDEVSPLMPAWYDLIWMGLILLGFLLVPLSGLWLLWRMRGRSPASDR
ncbi:HAAS signaling domain-containing protein [Microbacterium sp. NIBRBAC000506063]|uniref:HAAS signaling domain-containing protein n=1 Tax=Microbacterium sp. NIBRBAC000506063 TaxID=2734618 RepID=UPI001BB4E08A|nr:hypothetical protein [Microbacterium sp. NIBRBAC000506063]QTV79186.1 hypothetical protein KAE78_08935 [Microbacterium sp. NIBRBAC000506063]